MLPRTQTLQEAWTQAGARQGRGLGDRVTPNHGPGWALLAKAMPGATHPPAPGVQLVTVPSPRQLRSPVFSGQDL